jgi:hypothetical protein
VASIRINPNDIRNTNDTVSMKGKKERIKKKTFALQNLFSPLVAFLDLLLPVIFRINQFYKAYPLLKTTRYSNL